MAKRNTSAKPVCQACNRPFDPRSPGATPRMGPTCAKRAGAALAILDLGQLDFELEPTPTLDLSLRPPPLPFPKISPRQIPRRFDERYAEAKISFDELYREFCQLTPPVVGDAADRLDLELRAGEGVVSYALRDPTLTWLEPEHDLTLLIEPTRGAVYHRRAFNGVLTYLEIDCSRSPTARHHVEVITSFARAMTEHHLMVASIQPSLVEL